MSVRLTPFVLGEYYHIYNRGNSKQTIFHDNDDMQRFQDLLFIVNKTERADVRNIERMTRRQDLHTGEGLVYEDTNTAILASSILPGFTRLVAIGSYCIMPNHFHILITPLVEGGVSKFMQKLSTAYPMYYNKKYQHSGGLFEGKFKAEHASDDRHLKYLFAYINLNPIKLIDPTWKAYGLKNVKKTLEFLETYTYSSYLDLLNYGIKSKTRSEVEILSLNEFPNYFPTGALFKKEVIAWFSYRKNF